VLKPLLGRERSLALRQMIRHRGRTALTVGVLLVAVVFATGFGQTFLNNLDHIHEWLAEVLVADFYVRAAMPDPSASIVVAAVPAALGAEMEALDGVERVGRFSYVLARAGGQPVVILAYSYFPDGPVPLSLVEGDRPAVVRGLLQGEVVLGTALAGRLGLHAGDAVPIETRQGPQPLTVAGTATEYTGGGLALYMDWTTAERLFDLSGVHTYVVFARKGAGPELTARLQTLCDEHGLLLQSSAEVLRVFDRQNAAFVGFVWTLMALVFVVASLGIVNTLTMNVLEQTRELGILRAIGMKRSQVGKLVLAQALILAVMSLLAGVVAGVVLAYMMNLAGHAVVGQLVPLRLDPRHLGGCVVVALAVALAAAFFPALRAARLPIIRALQYE
jgi:putative ABC transport system permease protein